MSSAGLILAAGESRRMGSPKALLPYRGQSFLDTLTALLGAVCSPVIVVLGADADHVQAVAAPRAIFVRNTEYLRGQTSSLQCGLRAVPASASGVLFTLVDHPAVSADTLQWLLRPIDAEKVRVPRYRSRKGHPIWFSRDLITEFLELDDTGAARDVVRAHAADTAFIDVDDPGILADIDDPEAYRRLLETGGATP